MSNQKRWKYGRTLSHGLAVFEDKPVGEPEHIVAVAEDNVDHARLIAAAPELLQALKALTEDNLLSSKHFSAAQKAVARAEMGAACL